MDDVTRWVLDIMHWVVDVLTHLLDARIVIVGDRWAADPDTSGWSDPGSLGVLVTALGVVVAFYFNFRTNQRASVAEERSHASLVSAWVQRTSGVSEVHVRNASPALIYDVMVHFVDDRKRAKWFELGNGIVRPRTEERFSAGEVKPSRPQGVVTPFELWFTDASNQRWIRTDKGHLKKTKSSPPTEVGNLHSAGSEAAF